MKNKRNIAFIVFLIVSFSLHFAGAFIQTFQAESDGDNIILTWQTLSEDDVKNFEILRGPDKDNLVKIGTVSPKGNNSYYKYVDENAYKTQESFYSYGLVIVDKNNLRSSPIFRSVLHDGVSDVKRTWGSIKALFR